jgi:hypothetical protein
MHLFLDVWLPGFITGACVFGTLASAATVRAITGRWRRD